MYVNIKYKQSWGIKLISILKENPGTIQSVKQKWNSSCQQFAAGY